MTTDCDISVIYQKIILGITTFSQYVKELLKLKAQGLTPKATCLIIDDVMITNHQTCRIATVKHQYVKNF